MLKARTLSISPGQVMRAGAIVHIACNDSALSDKIISLRDAGAPTAMTATALALAMGILDVSGAPPRRRVFAIMAQHARDEMERQRLQHFSTALGREELALYCSTEKRSLLEVVLPPLMAETVKEHITASRHSGITALCSRWLDLHVS
jgi:sulfite reductase alpha subunit-like flavoprotein